ncbi:YybH family protein [Sutcliffiella halmapala]|uniref:YybH family protein n=1 Tax=Sutcliffiella halmapala TaxID=79882 RepID=UPI000995A754|nr:DUF4440 domain-containing protein [Sutcliffiella halmapala]
MDYKVALAKYIEATNTHDFNNVKVLLNDNPTYWFTNQTCTSIEEVQAYFENAWNVIKEEVYSAQEVTWLTVDQHSATCIYSYHYEGYYNGDFVTGSGRATNIFTKDADGEWKLLHEHLSKGVK